MGPGVWTGPGSFAVLAPTPTLCHAHPLRRAAEISRQVPWLAGGDRPGDPGHSAVLTSPHLEGAQRGGAIAGPLVRAHARRTSRPAAPSGRQPFRAAGDTSPRRCWVGAVGAGQALGPEFPKLGPCASS